MLVLGLDLGTTNAKVAAYDLKGRVQAEASVAYPTAFPRPGWAEQRPVDWTRALTEAVRRLTEQLGPRTDEIAGAALASQGPGFVLIDADGGLLTETSPTWQDERCLPQGRRLFERVRSHWPGIGGPFTNFPSKLFWAQENQAEAVAKAAHAMGIKDYLVHWLTGEAVTEPTSGSGGPVWHAAVFAALDWPRSRLPRIVRPTDVVGLLRPEIAREMGLPRPLPLVIGLNDGAAATLATGALQLGDTILTLSTNGVYRVVMSEAVTTEIRIDHNLFNWPYLPPELWIAGGQTKAGASALQWFADAIGGSEPVAIDRLLAEAAEIEPGSRGVVFLPYLMGRGSPRSDIERTGTFFGMRLSTRRGALARAVLEGVGFALRDIQEDFAGFGHPPAPIRLSGGGGRSPLWRQMLADILGQPLEYHASDSTLGSAMIASVGLRLHADLPSAVRAMSAPQTRVEPIASNVVRYGELYGEFCRFRDLGTATG